MRYIVIVCFKIVRNRAASFARDNIRSLKQAKTLAKEFAYMPNVDSVIIREVRVSKKTKWGWETKDLDIYKTEDDHKHHLIKGATIKGYKHHITPLVFGDREFNLY